MEINIEDLVPETIGGYCGLLAPFVGYVFITIATAMHGNFTLAESALSDLGEVGVPYNEIFNSALIVTGILLLVFAISLLSRTESRVGDIGLIGLIFGAIFLMLTGIFPKGTSPHLPVAILFYALSFAGLIFYGLDKFLEFEPVWAIFIWSSAGFATISIGLISVLSPSGFAIYEIIGTIPLMQFTLVFGTKLLTD